MMKACDFVNDGTSTATSIATSITTSITTSTSTGVMEKDPFLTEMDLLVFDSHAPTLFELARETNWDELLYRVEMMPSCFIREQTDPIMEDGDTLLHLVAGMDNVPISVVETIVRHTITKESNLASLRNQSQQTPLHVAVSLIPERTEVIQCLYQACPESVHARDSQQLRPIDIITERIIMLEEVIKYSTKDVKKDWQDMICSFWQSVSVLVGATPSTTKHHSRLNESHTQATTLLLHSCLQSKDVPFALTERAMTHSKAQLLLPDDNGDLPLHIVSRIPPQVQSHTRSSLDDYDQDQDDESESESDNGEDDFLNRVISLYPAAAFRYNNEQQLPLIVAIQAGRKWASGISSLLQANPGAIEDVQLPLNVFPYLLELLLSSRQDTTFRILQSQPELFLHNT